MDTTCKPNTPHDTQSNSSSPGPKHVTFDLPESSSDQTKEDLTNETPDLGSTGKSHNKSETISVTSNNVTLDSQPSRLGRYKKGLNASFLRHNPRHINEPVCHVLPNETSSSVQDCLQWEPAQGVQSNPQRKKTHSLDSTSRADYQPLPSNQRPPPLNKHLPPTVIHGTAPLVNEPKNGAGSSKVKERISYRHQYNCRTDPNEPVRGKLHGSFVWKPV